MASLTQTKKTGAWRVLFSDCAGRRKTVHVGKIDELTARAVFAHVDHLCTAMATGTPPHKNTVLWLADIGDPLHDRLARAGLVEPRESKQEVTLDQLIDRFVAAANVSDVTLAAYRQTTGSLLEFFGGDRDVCTISSEDANLWRRRLDDQGYAEATQAKRTHVARTIFNRAKQWGIVQANPFKGVRAGSQRNPDRIHYVSLEDVERVIAHCPDASWRATVGLLRYAGLRCPSEVCLLTWEAVNLLERRLLVKSPKTRHHSKQGIRFTPIVPRLAELLEDLFEMAEPGEPLLFPRLTSTTNLGPVLSDIIVRAGLKPWPRLLQNLRASRAMDWRRQFPAKDAAEWLGHSQIVADWHYDQAMDKHFREATGLSCARQSAQHDAVSGRTTPHEKTEPVGRYGFMRPGTVADGWDSYGEMGDTGLEPVLESPIETAVSGRCAQIPTRAVSPIVQTSLAWAASTHPLGR